MEQSYKGLSKTTLQRMACVSMFMDHFAKVILKAPLFKDNPFVGSLATVFIIVGRMAFPVFAFFIAEGCRRTSNPVKYLIRLLIFAVLAEIPFQLCFDNKLHPGATNVIFTMFLSAYAIFSQRVLADKGAPTITWWIPAILMEMAAWFLGTDYRSYGVLLVLAFYYSPRKHTIPVLGIWSLLTYLTMADILQYPLLYLTYAYTAFATGIFLRRYNGQRGSGNRWAMYIFYPAHMLLLGLVARYILQ